jgi:hypothetical protein
LIEIKERHTRCRYMLLRARREFGQIVRKCDVVLFSYSKEWQDWLNLVLRLWICVSPWALNFTDATATRTAIAIGFLIIVCEVFTFWVDLVKKGSRCTLHAICDQPPLIRLAFSDWRVRKTGLFTASW